MPKLSIIVPIYNEARHLTELVDGFLKSPCPIEREWIFVDDGSIDPSLSLLHRFASHPEVTIHSLPINQGKGAAVKAGLLAATGDIVMIQDADFEYDPSEIPLLLLPILENRADVVYGSRYLKGRQRQPWLAYAANQLLTFLSNRLSGQRLTDMETCYKVFRRPLVAPHSIQSQRFGIEIELTSRLINHRLTEVPISYRPRKPGDGKKITWKDGIAALWHLLRFYGPTWRKPRIALRINARSC